MTALFRGQKVFSGMEPSDIYHANAHVLQMYSLGSKVQRTAVCWEAAQAGQADVPLTWSPITCSGWAFGKISSL